MNSLTLGFLYVVGISWGLAETCVVASNGNYIPLWIFLAIFLLMFCVLGCAKISDRSVEVVGGLLAIALAALLVWISATTLLSGASGLGLVKMIFAIAFVIAGLISLIAPGGRKHNH